MLSNSKDFYSTAQERADDGASGPGAEAEIRENPPREGGELSDSDRVTGGGDGSGGQRVA